MNQESKSCSSLSSCPFSQGRFIIFTLLLLILLAGIGYTQFLKKEIIATVLEYEFDLDNPPVSIYAISTTDQQLSTGKKLPKGTRLIGMLSKEGDTPVIYFNAIQTPDGKQEEFTGKTSLNTQETKDEGGVSARIGKTLYNQTKTNVLGAIFNTSQTSKSSGQILPRGSVLKIELE